MTTLNIESMKVAKSSAKKIREFVYDNRNELSIEMKLFYQDVASMIEAQASKPKGTWHKITDMKDILERVYNMEKYVVNSGAASYEVEYC